MALFAAKKTHPLYHQPHSRIRVENRYCPKTKLTVIVVSTSTACPLKSVGRYRHRRTASKNLTEVQKYSARSFVFINER